VRCLKFYARMVPAMMALDAHEEFDERSERCIDDDDIMTAATKLPAKSTTRARCPFRLAGIELGKAQSAVAR